MRKKKSIPQSTPLTIIFGVVAIAVVAFIVVSPATFNFTPSGPTTSYKIPYTVTTVYDENIKLSDYQGKGIVYYFTGASCIPCKAQLPYIVNAYNTYKSTGKIEVFSFDIQGTSTASIIAWKNDNGITWKVCQDTGMTMSSYFSIYSMPTLVICDKNGNEVNRYVGAQSESTINSIFAALAG